MINGINFKLKDKIFLAIVALGLLAFLYNKITGIDREDGSSEESQVQSIQPGEETGNLDTWNMDENQKEAEIKIGDSQIKVRIASTDQERYQGLSNVENLASNEGMLFIHSEPGFYEYVMRDMRFDLDFVFVQGDEIVDVKKNISKDYDGIITGDSAYDKILELNAGTARRLNILVGEKAAILN